MSDSKVHHLTNDDLGHRLSDLEHGLSAVLAEQGKQGVRLDVLEQRWDWLTATLGRLLGRQEEIVERTQVILQRHDQSDEHIRDVKRAVRDVELKVDNLSCFKGPGENLR